MGNSEGVAKWCAANPAIARGRLFTAQRAVSTASRELGQLMGYLDSYRATDADTTRQQTQYIELGITEILSQLTRAVRALDMVPDPPTTPWRTK